MKHAIQLGPEEEIVTIIRRHWYHIAITGMIHVAILIGAVVLVGTLSGYVFSESEMFDANKLVALSLYTLSFFGLLLWMHFFAAWSDHWLDAWVVTNKRIIDIEQHGFFRRTVSSFPIERIQDVTYDVSGIIATWLLFGDVRIQTASITQDLIMKQVPFPADIKEHLMSVLNTKKQIETL